MTSLSALTKHMASFLLTSQRLNRSGQRKTAYRYFQLFLETVANFPSVAQSLTTYYAQYLAILNQGVVTLFPFLEQMKDHLRRNDLGTPFSGAANGNKQPYNQPKRKKSNKGNKTNQANQRIPRWSPHGPTLLSAATAPTTTPSPDYSPYVSIIQWLLVQSALARSPDRCPATTRAQLSIFRLPDRPPSYPPPDPVNFTVGSMGGTTPTMETHVNHGVKLGLVYHSYEHC
jgi:hypothetical protein